MLYADTSQINFQVPFEAQAGSATCWCARRWG